jgi:hypothetical protein
MLNIAVSLLAIAATALQQAAGRQFAFWTRSRL